MAAVVSGRSCGIAVVAWHRGGGDRGIVVVAAVALWQSCRVAVVAWHGGGGRVVAVVAVVMSSGCGGGSGGRVARRWPHRGALSGRRIALRWQRWCRRGSVVVVVDASSHRVAWERWR
jgi:hypothetical protein